MDETLEDRLAEIEHAQAHFRLATDGTDGWVNYIQSQILQTRQTERAVLAEVIASLQREFEATAKRIVSEAMEKRIRGTYDPNNKYDLGDVVARDGGSFMAKFTGPGPCPGPGWQLIAKQGARGIAGERGPAGKDAPRIVKWELNVASYTAVPIMSDGSRGPALELRAMFQQFLTEAKL
jgi:hypothetical protein